MASFFGAEIPGIPEINVVGWFSNTWMWIALVGFIGVVLIISAVLVIFFMTYKRKVIIFEEINHELVPVMTTRARIIRLRAGGEEVMKTLMGGYYVSAYSKRIGKSSYWFLRGTDGYLYNFVLDSYGKPIFVSGDMRMFNIAIDRLSQQTYGKQSFMEKYAVHMILFVFLVVLVLGMWFIVSKIGDVTAPLTASTKANTELMEASKGILSSLDNILRSMGKLPTEVNTTSGLVAAT